eukprot:gene32612-42232_t
MSSPPPSPPKSPSKKNRKSVEVTRFGTVKEPALKFGSEERFAWQNAQNSSNVVYDIPDSSPTKSVIFGSSLRVDENSKGSGSSAGPGSYDFTKCFDHISEYSVKQGNRFSCAPRNSMVIKTPSPGAVYNIEKCYWNGPDKNDGIGFSTAPRDSRNSGSNSADADMYLPKYDTGQGITIATRFNTNKKFAYATPGAIYDVHKKFDFRTGPSYTFGKGKGSRFKEVGFLPDSG